MLISISTTNLNLYFLLSHKQRLCYFVYILYVFVKIYYSSSKIQKKNTNFRFFKNELNKPIYQINKR